ncbi:hypothetical protein [Hyalangium versicolor]|uniref:hypothetical protein n=1 Tax=Hyalangium versicolor TaxID=2861190 RepID=UPI001CCD7B05|nr:hypothetical protein [Hyalangium versicolor]
MAGPVSGGQSDISQMIFSHREHLSQVQSQMVAAAPPEQRPFLEAQFKFENESQATELITKMLKGDDTMNVLRNL